MIPLYSESDFLSAKSRSLLPLQCKYCNKTFYRSKNQIQAIIKKNSNHTGDFCSPKCTISHYHPTIYVNCANCQKSFVKTKFHIKNTKNNFCCQSCAATYNNSHKTKGTRRSKLEIWLEKELPKFFPSLTFLFSFGLVQFLL
jgi:hypothetical protein